MKQIEFRQAVRDALDEELAHDPSVIFFGEDVGSAGGVFNVTPGLMEAHPNRVFDTPISELALAGSGFGAAITGLRPVVEIMFGDFLPLAMDSMINQSAKWWFVSNEQTSVPVTFRSIVGGGARFGAIHSQMPIAWVNGVPGLKIVAPATVDDAAALLKASIRDNNPVLFFEHKRLYSMKGERTSAEPAALGQARVVRAGADITIVAAMKSVHDCLAAAEVLAADGIDAEVVDVRTIRPLDWNTIRISLEKTNRLVVVEEGPTTGGWAAGVLALALERAVEHIDDAWRLTSPDHPVPYSPPLEDAYFNSAEEIAASVKGRLRAPTRIPGYSAA